MNDLEELERERGNGEYMDTKQLQLPQAVLWISGHGRQVMKCVLFL